MPNKDESPSCIDIREDDLLALSAEVLDTLLRDHTTGKNIFWATHDYEALGSEYDYHSEILPHLITGEHGMVIRPRVLKSKEQQTDRAKDMAEVFTPSWVCNAQNNLVDEAWFGRKDVFNVEDAANHTWKPNSDKIEFPKGKTWRDYVSDTRIEVTCGEAPYLVSRYDTTTGEFIAIHNRIGILDRKLRVINENVDIESEWVNAAKAAYMSTYGYEWQGDNLLLAREALLWTFIENFQMKFGKNPAIYRQLKTIAYIISWNIWQMDGLKMVVPESCHPVPTQGSFDLFGEPVMEPCYGCKNGTITGHNGQLCLIREWEILYKRTPDKPLTGKRGKKIPFLHVLKPKKQ